MGHETDTDEVFDLDFSHLELSIFSPSLASIFPFSFVEQVLVKHLFRASCVSDSHCGSHGLT